MLLHELLQRFDPELALDRWPDVSVSGIQEDSRKIKIGDIFVARGGTQINGSQFALDAVANGAVAVIAENTIPNIRVPQIIVPKSSVALSVLSQLFFDDPTRVLPTIGITGTNGKTTTAYIIKHLLAVIGIRCGLIGTVEIDDGKSVRDAQMTTPGACELAELLATMRDSKCGACAMEVSSHAMDQDRVAGMQFAAAGFTNLTGDHLDYHKTMEHYASAKGRLFEMLDKNAVAILNGGSDWSSWMERKCQGRILRFGFEKEFDYRAMNCQSDSRGTRFELQTPRGNVPIHMQLIGRHNIENALLAAALVSEAFGMNPEQIASGLASTIGAPGRLQPVQQGQPFSVLVDYAHTDDALENVLKALKPLTHGKLRVLFGCGGNRDESKRPRMAAIAEKLADVVYVTSDNPRKESAESIIDMVSKGFSGQKIKPVYRQVDRRAAIEQVLYDANEGDVVLLAGKGHENYQIIGEEKRHFDDLEEARRVLTLRFPQQKKTTHS